MTNDRPGRCATWPPGWGRSGSDVWLWCVYAIDTFSLYSTKMQIRINYSSKSIHKLIIHFKSVHNLDGMIILIRKNEMTCKMRNIQKTKSSPWAFTTRSPMWENLARSPLPLTSPKIPPARVVTIPVEALSLLIAGGSLSAMYLAWEGNKRDRCTYFLCW